MASGYKAKICGTTNLEDAQIAANAGADFFGVVLEVGFSPRSLSLDEAEPLFADPPVPAVALVYNMERARIETLIRKLSPFAVQFLNLADIEHIKGLKTRHPDMELWQSVHLPQVGKDVDVNHFRKTIEVYIDAGIDAIFVDTAAITGGKMKFGGTGLTSDWHMVKNLMLAVQSRVPIWLAGGINPGNVGSALDMTDPYGIDLCSGVEAVPGKKDPLKVQALMTTINEKSATGEISIESSSRSRKK
jgi:phosphoribosylanthranilate isomerase